MGMTDDELIKQVAETYGAISPKVGKIADEWIREIVEKFSHLETFYEPRSTMSLLYEMMEVRKGYMDAIMAGNELKARSLAELGVWLCFQMMKRCEKESPGCMKGGAERFLKSRLASRN